VAWKLPPLNGLRALEAAGRHVSFTKAAEELHVTPGAVSRQVSSLEDYLGVEFFDRTHRELTLRPSGATYVPLITDALRQIDRATRQLLNVADETKLRLFCSMTFSLRWLLPRLSQFHSKHPKLDIHLTTTIPTVLEQLVDDLLAGETDVAVRIAKQDPPSLVSYPLIPIQWLPVCSPKLLRAGPPLRRVEDLAHHVLLYSQARPDDWDIWLSAAGSSLPDHAGDLRFESSVLAYESAIEGLGIAIGMKTLVADDLLSGRLVAPFDLVHQDGTAFRLAYLPGRGPRAARVEQLVKWMTDVATQDNRRVDAIDPVALRRRFVVAEGDPAPPNAGQTSGENVNGAPLNAHKRSRVRPGTISSTSKPDGPTAKVARSV